MKSIFCLILSLYAVNTWGQVPFPKGFRLIKGESLVGSDDAYTNGKYTFIVHTTGWIEDSANYAEVLAESFGFPFRQTKDSLYWGTGKNKNLYSYVVYAGELVELYSEYNDSGFSYYSKWLLSTLRKYRYSKKMLFPPRSEKEIKAALDKGD